MSLWLRFESYENAVSISKIARVDGIPKSMRVPSHAMSVTLTKNTMRPHLKRLTNLYEKQWGLKNSLEVNGSKTQFLRI